MNLKTHCPFCKSQLVCSVDGMNEYAVNCRCNFKYNYFEFNRSDRYEFSIENTSKDTVYIVFGRSYNDIYAIKVVLSSRYKNLTVLNFNKGLTLENFYIEFQKYIEMAKNNTLEPLIKKLVMLS